MKASKIKEISIYALIFLIIVGGALFILTKFVTPSNCTRQGFIVTINGQVKTEIDDSFKYPEYIRAYYSYHNVNQLSEQASSFDLAKIYWGGKRGNFSMTFWVPVEMDLIITSDATSCNYKIVHVSPKDNLRTVELSFDDKKCTDALNIPKEKEEIRKQTRTNIDRLLGELTKPAFSISESDSIRKDIMGASRENEKIDAEMNETKLMTYTYNAFWLSWRAEYKLELSRLHKCVENATSILSKNTSCVVLPYETKMNILYANVTYENFKNDWIMNREVYNIDSIEESYNYIQNTQSRRNEVMAAAYRCEYNLDVATKSYNDQESVCTIREKIITSLNWIFALVFICVGLILYPFLKGWISKK